MSARRTSARSPLAASVRLTDRRAAPPRLPSPSIPDDEDDEDDEDNEGRERSDTVVGELDALRTRVALLEAQLEEARVAARAVVELEWGKTDNRRLALLPKESAWARLRDVAKGGGERGQR